VPTDDVVVVASSARQNLLISLAVSANDPDVALALANAIPRAVAEERRANIGTAIGTEVESLRERADDALARATELDTRMLELVEEGSNEELFQLRQRRDALAAQYAALNGRAEELSLAAAHRPAVGFELSAPAEGVARRFPPPWQELVPVALVVGLLAGLTLVIGPALLSGGIQREQLDQTGSGRYLGLVRSGDGRRTEGQLEVAGGRLRALFGLERPRSLLVTTIGIGTRPEAVWWATCGLARSLAESGYEVGVLGLEFEHGVVEEHRAGEASPRVEFLSGGEYPTSVIGRWYRIFQAQRIGGSALAAAYAPETVAGIDHLRSLHDVLFVDATRGVAGGWLGAVSPPDLAVLVATEGRTTRDRYEATKRQLEDAEIPSVVMLLTEKRRLGRRGGLAARGRGPSRADGTGTSTAAESEGVTARDDDLCDPVVWPGRD
jgi:hypothetical protein